MGFFILSGLFMVSDLFRSITGWTLMWFFQPPQNPVYLLKTACYTLTAYFGIVKFYSVDVYHMALRINEIFYSIQGESTAVGLPFVFVRLTGCNLRCHYCDTRYAYDEGQWLENDTILERVSRFACPRVAVTGGEPLLQDQTPILIADMLARGYDVSMETNGSLDISVLDPRCTIVMDIKCPSSGMHAHNRLPNLKRLGFKDQVKFVIADRF